MEPDDSDNVPSLVLGAVIGMLIVIAWTLGAYFGRSPFAP